MTELRCRPRQSVCEVSVAAVRKKKVGGVRAVGVYVIW